jgi:CHAT domain-containing protein/Tfp pilus assembly protein PilF
MAIYKYPTSCLLLVILFITNPCPAQTNTPDTTADSLYQQGDFAGAARAYHQLADQLREEGFYELIYEYRYWEAKSLIQQYEYAQAREILHEILSASDVTIGPGLLSKVYHETGYTYMGEGNMEEGLKLSEMSIATELNRTDVDTFQLAKYQEFNGFLRLQSGEYDEAEKRVVQAHRLRQKILDPMNRELGYSANTLYIVLDALGKLQAADTVISQAWRILNHHLPEDHPHIAVLANNYGTHLLDMGKPQDAREYLLRAIASNEKGERFFPLTGNYVNLGLLHLNLNESQTAEAYYRQAWEIADTLIAYPDYQRANIQDALGAAYYQQGMIDEAESWFQSAYAEKRELYDRQSAEIAQSLYNLGLIAREREEKVGARDYFIEAGQIRALVLGTQHPKRADALYELGEVVWEERAEAGIRYWKAALGIYEQNYGLTHQHSLETIIRLAEAYAQLQQPDSLQYYLQMGWSSAAGRQENYQDILLADSLTLRQYHPFVLDLINLHLRTLAKKGGELDSENFAEAYRVLQAAEDWLPSFQSLFNDAALRESVSAQIQEVFQQGAILAHHALRKQQNNTDWQDMLLSCIQSSRGSTIRAAFRDREAIRFAGVPDSLTAQGNELQRRLQFVLARQQEDVDDDALRQLALQQQGILQDWQEYQQMLKNNYPQYFRTRYQRQSIRREELQRELGTKDQVLAYFNLDSALLAVSLSKDVMMSNWLSMPTGWQDSLSTYQQLMKSQREPFRQASLGYFLYQHLWEPLAIPGQSTVKILADGPLHYLNFETLLTQEAGMQAEKQPWPWLIREYCVYYGHSLEPQVAFAAQRGGKVLGIAPGFSQQLKNQYLENLPQRHTADSVFLNWLRTPWSLAFVNQLQEQGWGISMTEAAATEQGFISEAPGADILHFGTHARLENDRPLYSFLALTPEPGGEQDGYLHTYELYSQPLQAQLAVLTACETGLGEYRRGDGVLSLAHAFRYAGCPSVVYSLWSIDDQQSNEIIASFYENLRQDMPYAEALRAAKLSYLDQHQNGLQSPFYWAGLVLTGENTSYVSASFAYLYWLVGLLLVLAAVFVFSRQVRKKQPAEKN